MNTPESENFVYVREYTVMEALIERIGAAERVAVDTEADSLHNYFEKVCLIQLSLGDEHLEDMVAEFREREDLSPRMVEKMLSDNPRKLYGL